MDSKRVYDTPSAIFAQRLKKLLEERDMRQVDLARQLQVGRSTISQYLSGTRRPELGLVWIIANLFHVSSDYLLGLTDDPTPPGQRPAAPVEVPDQQFEAMLRGRGLSQEDIELIKLMEERRHREKMARERDKGEPGRP